MLMCSSFEFSASALSITIDKATYWDAANLEPGNYTFTYMVTVDDLPAPDTDLQETFSFILELTNPCENATLTEPIFSDVEHFVDDPALLIDFAANYTNAYSLDDTDGYCTVLITQESNSIELDTEYTFNNISQTITINRLTTLELAGADPPSSTDDL